MDLKTYALSKLVGGSSKESGKMKLTDAYYFCCYGRRLDMLSEIDISECEDFGYMFYYCSNLTTIPALNTSKGTKFDYMFQYCSSLTTIPPLDLSKGTRFGHMFQGCSNLTTIPELNTSSGTDFTSMFVSCSNLTTISALDVSSGTNFGGMFRGCSKLTNLTLYNIRKSMDISPSTSLTVDSLVNTIKELCTASSTQILTMGGANLSKISNLYCKVTDNTSEKKPMELCESIDEGAMTLGAYAALKNWQLE